MCRGVTQGGELFIRVLFLIIIQRYTNNLQHRCLDFSSNPYATVLIPEPMDYFAACSATSMCHAKCNAEFNAFDRQLAEEAALHSLSPMSKTVEKTTESMLFVDLDEDAYTPMNIMAMVELSDCRYVCVCVYVCVVHVCVCVCVN